MQPNRHLAPDTKTSLNLPAAIAVAGLSVRYGRDVLALGGVDLAFAPGGFTVLLGPSGAGKSTLLRCLNGLARPSAGQVLGADGAPIQRRLRAHRRQTGMVFQQHQLIGRLSVLDNVLIGLLGQRRPWTALLPPSRAERERALDALDRVGLIERALTRADALSGGQQQRVGRSCIWRAIPAMPAPWCSGPG